MFFMYSPTLPSPQQEIQFKDFSRGNPTSWLWDFGDGATSILQNPSHAFKTSGIYKVTLTARNNSSSGRTSRTLKVVLSLSASFTRNPSNPIVGQEVQFTDSSTGNPTSRQWNFGDGATSTLQNPSHTYTTAGSYTVSLAVANSSGSKSTSQTVNVASALVASFIYSPTSPVIGQGVQFTDTTTGSPTSWLWDFGDGITSNSQNPSHTYTTAGSYAVTLTVFYSSGSQSVSQTINVLPPSTLTASFTYSPSSPVTGQAVQFTDISTGNPTSWLWNFGDNTTSTSKNPSHTYATAASYTVTLTVTNNSASKSVSQTITVLPASTLAASFTYSPSSPVAGQAIQFTDTSTGSPTSWQWNFGDNTTSTSQNPVHSYSTAASYTVTLTVSNNSDSKSTSQTVTVLPVFAASFAYSPASPAANQAVQFTDTSTGSPTAWQWNFGDSATSTVQNPNHTYTATGQYWVNLIITKGTESHSTSQMITVRQPGTITAASPSYADVSAAVSSASPGDTVIVPVGTATWSSNLIITKGIKLIGAGIGQTVITGNFINNYNGDYFNTGSHIIVYQPASPALNEPFRLSGFTFDLDFKSNGIYLCNWTATYPISKVRIDHVKVANQYPNHYPFVIYGTVYGVMDNCELSNTRCWNDNANAWTYLSFSFGSANNFYFEDNIFTLGSQRTLSYGEGGAVFCFRHNNIILTADMFPIFDAHGNSAWHSTMGMEFYENTIDAAGHYMSLADQRGGMGLIYNNSVSNTSSTYIQVREECLDSLNPPANNVLTGQPQHVSSSYFWNNMAGSTLIRAIVNGTLTYPAPDLVTPRANYHYWEQGTTFDGTTGVGVGPLSARPANCTKSVGYWATDTNTLYRAKATNTWEEFYKPYTYPHPLRSQH
jgi:PKD repeat protein